MMWKMPVWQDGFSFRICYRWFTQTLSDDTHALVYWFRRGVFCKAACQSLTAIGLFRGHCVSVPVIDCRKQAACQSNPALVPDVKTAMMDPCFESVNHSPRHHLFIKLPASVCVSAYEMRKTSRQEIVWLIPQRTQCVILELGVHFREIFPLTQRM